MSFIFELTADFCGVDVDEEDDEIDFCGMPSQQIVEIAIRRDFLLLRLQALVDATTLPEAVSAVVAMEKEAKADDKLLRFLVRAGTVEIIRGCKLLGEGDTTTNGATTNYSLLKKLLPYHQQRRLKELKKKQRGGWAIINIISRSGESQSMD